VENTALLKKKYCERSHLLQVAPFPLLAFPFPMAMAMAMFQFEFGLHARGSEGRIWGKSRAKRSESGKGKNFMPA